MMCLGGAYRTVLLLYIAHLIEGVSARTVLFVRRSRGFFESGHVLYEPLHFTVPVPSAAAATQRFRVSHVPALQFTHAMNPNP